MTSNKMPKGVERIDYIKRKQKRMVERLIEKIENSPDINKTNKEIISDWIAKNRAEGLSPSILIHNIRIIGKIAIFLKDRSLKDTTLKDIQNFVTNLREGFKLPNKTFINEKGKYLTSFGPYKQSSLNTYNAVIKKFYRWIYGLPKDKDPAITEWIRTRVKPNNRKLPEDLLTPDDIKKMLAMADNQRDRALVMTLYESGARCGEFLALRIKHISFDDYGAIMLIPEGKTGARRRRLIDSIPDLRLWLNQHPLKNNREAPLWVNLRYGDFQPLGAAGVERMLKKLARKAKIGKRVHPHLLRHSIFTKLAQNFTGAELKEMGGWSSRSEMIDTYVHLAGVDIDKKYLELKGVMVEKKEQKNPLSPRPCPRCNEENPPLSRFCNRCSMPLDEKTAIELEKKKHLEMELHQELFKLNIDKNDITQVTDIKDLLFNVIRQDKRLLAKLKEIVT